MPQDPLTPPSGLGWRERIGWLAGRSAKLPRKADEGFWVSGTCDAGTRWQLGGESCAQSSVWVVWVGCAGEHIGPVELCQAHNDLIGAQAIQTLCVQCGQNGVQGRHLAVIKREKI
jgi:hypothetical protein